MGQRGQTLFSFAFAWRYISGGLGSAPAQELRAKELSYLNTRNN